MFYNHPYLYTWWTLYIYVTIIVVHISINDWHMTSKTGQFYVLALFFFLRCFLIDFDMIWRGQRWWWWWINFVKYFFFLFRSNILHTLHVWYETYRYCDKNHLNWRVCTFLSRIWSFTHRKIFILKFKTICFTNNYILLIIEHLIQINSHY